MAYAAAVTVTNLSVRKWLVTISETDCGVADEAAITGLPSRARLLKQVTSLVSGTGTTVDPVIGTATNPTGVNVVASNDTAAADVNNVASPAIAFVSTTGLFHRSNPDAGADNVIQTQYLFLGGWE